LSKSRISNPSAGIVRPGRKSAPGDEARPEPETRHRGHQGGAGSRFADHAESARETAREPARESLAPGLYFVATPIGAARDITLRALDILRVADVLAAEDTRNTRHLLDIHGIALRGRPLIAYHDHNGPARRPQLIGMIREGRAVAYVSDAGTPLVADPGYALGRAAIDEGLPVMAAPGPSALLAALTVAGLPTDQFFFAGFPPARAGPRRKMLQSLVAVPGTLVFYESPRRIVRTLNDMAEILGAGRAAVLCRELTKKFEQTRRDTLEGLARSCVQDPPRGEIVLLVAPTRAVAADDDAIDARLRGALAAGMSLRDAVDHVAADSGRARRDVYRLALGLKGDS